MPKTINDSNGAEIEVFTADEIEAQKEAAIEEYKANNPDKTAELERLQQEKTKLESDMKGLKDKDFNFASVRKALAEKDEEIKKMNSSIDEKIGAAKKEVLEGVMKDHYNDTLKKLVGDDKDLLAKVELQYKRLADTASTKEEITKKMQDAFTLATGYGREAIDSGAFSSGGVSRIANKNNANKTPLTPAEKELGKKLAQAGGLKVEDKDFE